MLTNTKNLSGFAIHATDGPIGTVDDLYFDDEAWTIRYLTVETDGWLGRHVLISPFAVQRIYTYEKRVDVSLTKMQIENSPNIDLHKPVSRQHEAEYLGYYGYPFYWAGTSLWGPGYYPLAPDVPAVLEARARTLTVQPESADSHLRGTSEVSGYHIDAGDGEIGHVEGFLIEDGIWVIRYVEVATRNWLPGKKVLISPDWIERVSWDESKVYVGLLKETISGGPEYDESKPITREFEESLYRHYGRAPYWLRDSAHQEILTMSGG